ncbi:MAG: hypothetical protein IKX51_01040 [Bacteroidales bacterium]|nr:hypothetical protein [Bacteroidales bacterium]
MNALKEFKTHLVEEVLPQKDNDWFVRALMGALSAVNEGCIEYEFNKLLLSTDYYDLLNKKEKKEAIRFARQMVKPLIKKNHKFSYIGIGPQGQCMEYFGAVPLQEDWLRWSYCRIYYLGYNTRLQHEFKKVIRRIKEKRSYKRLEVGE